jgi:tRNA-dihydrouridine synthase B
MKIGNIKLNNAFLAPMADINDIAFRVLCKRAGAGLICSEMVNANAIVRNNKATLKKIKFSDEEKPISIQIFGAKEDIISEAAKIVEKSGADIIDFNLGCPYDKVLRQGAGAALLKRPKKIGLIIKKLVESVSIPVTAKIRKCDKGIEIAKIIEENGASAIAVHPRTVKQGYSGKADWHFIKEIKENVSIPVIGSGDVFNFRDVKKMMKYTGCDGVMIGRGCIGNPNIFREVVEEKEIKIDKIELFFEYFRLCKEFGIDKFAHINRQALNFTKGIRSSGKFRNELSKVRDVDKLIELMKEFKKL